MFRQVVERRHLVTKLQPHSRDQNRVLAHGHCLANHLRNRSVVDLVGVLQRDVGPALAVDLQKNEVPCCGRQCSQTERGVSDPTISIVRSDRDRLTLVQAIGRVE